MRVLQHPPYYRTHRYCYDECVVHLDDLFCSLFANFSILLWENLCLSFFFFFFSSRRRHTRFKCDWSSDVCSSDLPHSKAPWPAPAASFPPSPRRMRPPRATTLTGPRSTSTIP